MDGMTPVGIVKGHVLWVSDAALAQVTIREVKEHFGLVRRYPVVTDLSGHTVMVEGNSHEDAVNNYLQSTTRQRKSPRPVKDGG